MPTPAKTAESGKKRGRPSKSSSAEKKKTSSPDKRKKSSSPASSSTKRPRGRPPKTTQVSSSNAPSVSVFDPNLPPPPPPPPPVNNPFYQKFVMEYWQNNYFYNMQSGAVITNIAGFGAPLSEELAAAAANLDSKPSAAPAAKASDEVESTSV